MHWTVTVTKPTEGFAQFLTICVGGEIRSQKLEGGKMAAFPYKPYIPPPPPHGCKLAVWHCSGMWGWGMASSMSVDSSWFRNEILAKFS